MTTMPYGGMELGWWSSEEKIGFLFDSHNNEEELHEVDKIKYFTLLEQYKKYKTEYAKNIRFDPTATHLSIYSVIDSKH